MRHRRLVILASWAFVLAMTPAAAQSMATVAEHYETRRYADATRDLDRLPAARDALGLVWAGRIALALGQHDRAIATLESAVTQARITKGTHLWLARAYAARAQASSMVGALRSIRRAKHYWQLALTEDPDDLEARSDLVGFHLTAPAVAGGRRDQADVHATAIGQRDAYLGGLERARIAAHDKAHSEAERIYRGLIATEPRRSSAYDRLALLLASQERWEDLTALLTYWANAVTADPLVDYHRGRGAALSGTALTAGASALQTYLAAPQRRGRPSAADAHYLLGLIAWKRGDSTGARRSLDAALAAEPRHPAARRLSATIGRP